MSVALFTQRHSSVRALHIVLQHRLRLCRRIIPHQPYLRLPGLTPALHGGVLQGKPALPLPTGLMVRSRCLLSSQSTSAGEPQEGSSSSSKNDSLASANDQGSSLLHVGTSTRNSNIHNNNNNLTSSSNAPTVVSAAYDITCDERLSELVAELEDKRQLRQQQLFEDLLVFQGGSLSDHESLGTSLIMRDFVHFGLYHNRWGYYPKLHRKYRSLATEGFFDPVPFASLRNQHDFERYVAKIHETTPTHVTPTQLFQPYYGWALAEYLVTTWRSKFDPREPLIVYDMGAGTGALALSVLDYMCEHFPAIYSRMEYHVVEQSAFFVPVLRAKLVHHYHRVSVHHISVFNWRQVEKRRCVVLAIELISRMPHDCILWDASFVCSEHWFNFLQKDNLSTAHERYAPLKDPIVLRYLRYLGWMQEETYHNLKVLCLTGGRETLDPPPLGSMDFRVEDDFHVLISKGLWAISPFHTAWLPTTQMLFLEVLAQYFPRHHLLLADWSAVGHPLPGYNGPTLQVKLRIAKGIYLRRNIESFHSNAGMVDMCFPTDFAHLTTVYKATCGGGKEIGCMSHPEFWRTFGGDKTNLFTTRSGFNPLVDDFGTFHVFTAHHPAEL